MAATVRDQRGLSQKAAEVGLSSATANSNHLAPVDTGLQPHGPRWAACSLGHKCALALAVLRSSAIGAEAAWALNVPDVGGSEEMTQLDFYLP